MNPSPDSILPFVLTGTIAPNATPTVHNNVLVRRDEYVFAIKHYLNFGPVYFIENSDYPVMNDPFFTTTPGLQTIQYPKSTQAGHGKGYQEFEMLDAFVNSHLHENAFVKITGRYLYKNIGDITPRLCSKLFTAGIVIDLLCQKQIAITSLFAVTKSYYTCHLMNAFKDMDDRKDQWAERILYRRVRTTRNSAILLPAPILQVISGSTGHSINMSTRGFRPWAKNMERRIFSAMGIRELLF